MNIAIASFKGGVGKTTTAIHIATFLGRLAPTLLIDGDPNESAHDYAEQGTMPFTVVRASDDYSPADFTHIVIDSEPRVSKEDLETLVAQMDLIIIPSQADATALRVLQKSIITLREMNAKNYKVLLTIVHPYPTADGKEAQEYLESLEIPVFSTVIRRYIAYSKASLLGISVDTVIDDRADAAWSDYENVAKEIINYDN